MKRRLRAGTRQDHFDDLSGLLADLTGRELFREQPLTNWRAAFAAFGELLQDGPIMIILDEFQFVARKEIMAESATTCGRRTGSLKLLPFEWEDEEPIFLLSQETRINEIDTYMSCLRAIAAGITSLNDIAMRVGKVERRSSVAGRSRRRASNKVYYAISDPFLRFWFRFVGPARAGSRPARTPSATSTTRSCPSSTSSSPRMRTSASAPRRTCSSSTASRSLRGSKCLRPSATMSGSSPPTRSAATEPGARRTHREVPDEGDCGDGRGRGNGRDDAGGAAGAAGRDK